MSFSAVGYLECVALSRLNKSHWVLRFTWYVIKGLWVCEFSHVKRFRPLFRCHRCKCMRVCAKVPLIHAQIIACMLCDKFCTSCIFAQEHLTTEFNSAIPFDWITWTPFRSFAPVKIVYFKFQIGWSFVNVRFPFKLNTDKASIIISWKISQHNLVRLCE